MEVHSALRVLGTVFRLKWQGGQRTAGRDIERPTMAATSNTKASFTLNLDRPVGCDATRMGGSARS
jgi:hypothetical protein